MRQHQDTSTHRNDIPDKRIPAESRYDSRHKSIDGVKHVVRSRPASEAVNNFGHGMTDRSLPVDAPSNTDARRPIQDVVKKRRAISNVKQGDDRVASGHKMQRATKRSSVLQRQTVSKPLKGRAAQKEVIRKQTKRVVKRANKIKQVTTVVSVITIMSTLGVITAFVFSPQFQSNQNVLSKSSEADRSATEQAAAEMISETRRSEADYNNHQVADDMPRLIRINSLDVTAKIETVGIGKGKQLITPHNIFDVGWYEGARKPGESGAVLLNAHVAGPNERGVFYYLRTLNQGDVIEIERGDGHIFTYEVREKRSIAHDKVDINSLLIPHEKGKNALNLLAVDNRYNVLSDEFQDRVVVFAVEL